ncbi:MAG: O-methyltransferase [Defluviitaleaceae bacterium]|nr:O-methyltransferase [Defluviitaleaceae bacterium]
MNDETIKYIKSLYKNSINVESEFFKNLRVQYEKFPIIKEDSSCFLISLLNIKKPTKVLEVGTCVGFSTMLMASMYEDIHVTTIERYPMMIDIAKSNFDKYSFNQKITLIEENAIYSIKNLELNEKKFDFIFLDAGKGQYIKFLPHLLNLLNLNGILISDNVLQNNNISKKWSDIEKRNRTIYINMRKFLYAITNTRGLISSILPIGDGISITTKIDNKIILNIPNEDFVKNFDY